jgi:hypothetical protein
LYYCERNEKANTHRDLTRLLGCAIILREIWIREGTQMFTIITTIIVSFVVGYMAGYIDRGTRIDSRLDFENLKITELQERIWRIK